MPDILDEIRDIVVDVESGASVSGNVKLSKTKRRQVYVSRLFSLKIRGLRERGNT